MASTKRAKKRQQKSSQKSLKFHLSYSNILSIALIILGAAILLTASLPTQFNLQPKLQKAQSQAPAQKPYKVYIPRMSKVLFVSDGDFQDGRWSTTLTGVSYYTDSALPGYGNTVIYGHNTADVIGGLWRVQDGDYIYIVLENGDFVKYQVYERKEINAQDVQILNQTEDSRLTLYTCSGFLDAARFVVTAKRV